MGDSIFGDLQIAASVQWPAPATSLAELALAVERLHGEPVLTLRQALAQLQLLDDDTLDALQRERPELLRNRSSELVKRLLVSGDELSHALSRMAGLPEVDAERFAVASDAFDVVARTMANTHEVVPLGRIGSRFYVASFHPTNEGLQNYLCFMTGHAVHMVWADRDSIQKRLGKSRAMPADPRAAAIPVSVPLELTDETAGLRPAGPASAPAEEITIDHALSQALIEVNTRQEYEEANLASESSGMVRLVRLMIQHARETGASDIHIESNPGDQPTYIRMRREGELANYLEVPARLRAALVSRVKVMAKLDISEHRRPQDGKIHFDEFGGGKLELRVAVMPTRDGLEDVVLRLLESQRPMPLSQLGLQERDAQVLARLSARTVGLVLAVGPTGAGKTTTLHSILADINTPARKFWTAEDPIEITQPGLRQVQVNPKIGVTFAAALRGFLRADPDVIMIGEIRDAETAKIAIEASLTGHLVMSTLHTNTAPETVVRLLDLGIDPFNAADCLLGIIAQRLVRALCPQCAQPRQLAQGQFERLVAEYIDQSPLSAAEGTRRLLAAAGVTSPEQVQIRVACGCEACGGSGYRGRTGVYEVLESTPALRGLIQSRARPRELYEAAVATGMRSLRHDALEKLVQGRLDLKQAKMAYL